MMTILQQIAEGVWSASWRASLLVGIVLAAQWLFARWLTAKWRHALWFLVVVRLALPVGPGSSWSVFNLFERKPKLAAPAPPKVLPVNSVLPAPQDFRPTSVELISPSPVQTAPSPTVAAARSRIELSAVFVLVWFTGVALFGFAAGVNSWRLSQEVRRMPRFRDLWLRKLLRECERSMETPGDVELIEAPEGTSPAIFGLWRVRLLLPASAANRFSREELRFIFLHELAHVKRRDVALNWVMMALQMAHWFNPIVWFAFARMRTDRELACDAMALECAGAQRKQAYGETIIRLLETFARPAAAPNLLGILENKSQMRRRLESIAKFQAASRWSWMAAIVLIGLGCAGLTDAQKEAKKETTSTNAVNLTRQKELYRQLGSIRVDEFPTPSEKSLFETLAELKNVIGDSDSKKSKVDFHIDRGLVDVSKFRIKFDPPIRNVTLGQFLDAVVMVAKPPTNSIDVGVGLGYSIENGVITFRARPGQPDKLYTRAFRLDPNVFLQGLEGVVFSANPFQGLIVSNNGNFSFGGSQKPAGTAKVATETDGAEPKVVTIVTNMSSIQDQVRAFFAAAGVEFPTNTHGPGQFGPALNNDSSAKKIMFYNDRAGVLFVRATLRELDIIVQALSALNRQPPQVRIEAKFIEFSAMDDKAFGIDWFFRNHTPTDPLAIFLGETNRPFISTVSGILTVPQFRDAMKAFESRTGIDVITAPAVTTVSGRQVRISVEESGKHLSPQTPPPRPRSTAPDANPTPAREHPRI